MTNYNFILITIIGRQIITFRFQTKKEAKEEMRRQFIKAGGDIEENNDYATLNEYSAWVRINDGDNHSDFAWKVVEVSEIPIFS